MSEYAIQPRRVRHQLPLKAEFRESDGYSWGGGRRCIGDVVLMIGTHAVARIDHSWTSDHVDEHTPEAQDEEYDEIARAIEGWFDRVDDMLREYDGLVRRVDDLERDRG